MKTQRRSRSRATARSSPRTPPISKFAQALLSAWRKLKLPVSDSVAIIGVSGGADSVALLMALDELIKGNKLKIELGVAHLDHRLRKQSADDARWVTQLAKQQGHSISVKRVDVMRLAKRSQDNLEQAARRARYRWFADVAQKLGAAVVLTAHTMDDQAETILMNLLRGSGADGLCGMEPVRPLDRSGKAMLARPLISWARRADTEAYCRAREINFRRDEMNEDEAFARVRARRRLMPVMESFNPRITEALARTAELLREDTRALDSAAERLLELSLNSSKKNQLRVDLVAQAPPALRRRALRIWLEKCRGDLRRLELVHIRAVEDLVTTNRGGRTIELPGGSTISRKRGLVTFNPRTSRRTRA